MSLPRLRMIVIGLVLLLVASACGTRVPELIEARNVSGAANGTSGSGLSSPGNGAPGPSSEDDFSAGPASDSDRGRDRAGTEADGGRDASGPSSGQADGALSPAAIAGQSDPGVTDTEIRIGLSAPLSGFLGFAGDQIAGALNAYFQMINDAGGINGRRLRLIAYDDGGDTGRMLANLRRLYEQDKVIAFTSFISTGGEDYIERNKIPTFIIGVEPTAYSSKFEYIHPLAEHWLAFVQEMPLGLKEAGAWKDGMRVGILYEPASQSAYLDLIKEAWTLAGAEVVTTDPLASSDTDCTSLVLKMRQLNIDFWDFTGATNWFFCVAAGQRQGYKPNIGWGSYSTSLQFLVKQAGPWSDGLWSGNLADKIPDGAPRKQTSAHTDMMAALKKYSPKIGNAADASAPTTVAYWIGGKMITDALKAVGPTVTRAAIQDFVVNLRNWDSGIAPPIKSMATNCKTGNGVAWFGTWTWNDGEPFITPKSGYQTSPYQDRYGGECYLTKLADSVG